jgi:hypothetical protein
MPIASLIASWRTPVAQIRFTSFCLAAALFAASAAQAAMRPAALLAISDIRPAAMGCGPGYRPDSTGVCVDYIDRWRKCPDTYFAESYPNGNGFRCVPSEWLREPGWLMDIFGR